MALKFFASEDSSIWLISVCANGSWANKAIIDVIVIKEITPNRHTVVNIVSTFELYSLKRVVIRAMMAYPKTYVAYVGQQLSGSSYISHVSKMGRYAAKVTAKYVITLII